MTVGRHAQLFQDSWGNLPPVVRALAKSADEFEQQLERCRIALGFTQEWSPYYDRKQRSGVSAAVTWSDKCGGINGMGDLQRFVGELCGGIDIIDAKIGEISAILSSGSTEKRSPGRPRKIP